MNSTETIYARGGNRWLVRTFSGGASIFQESLDTKDRKFWKIVYETYSTSGIEGKFLRFLAEGGITEVDE